MHAPHSPSPQAYLVPVRSRRSRSMVSAFMVGGTFTDLSAVEGEADFTSTDIVEHLFDKDFDKMAAVPRAGPHVIDGMSVPCSRGHRRGDARRVQRPVPRSAASAWRPCTGVGATEPNAMRTSASALRQARRTRPRRSRSRARGAGLAEAGDEVRRQPGEHDRVSSSRQADGLARPTKTAPAGRAASAPRRRASGQFDRGVQHQQWRAHVAGRRRVAQVAADRGGVADLVAREALGGLGEHRRHRGEPGVAADVGDGGCRADAGSRRRRSRCREAPRRAGCSAAWPRSGAPPTRSAARRSVPPRSTVASPSAIACSASSRRRGAGSRDLLGLCLGHGVQNLTGSR